MQLKTEPTKGQGILVADHSKRGVVSDYQAASLEKIHKFAADEVMKAQANEYPAGPSMDSLSAND
jgi:DeoR/GlpR family transcriptional regulator of sugar metabolism